MKCGGTEKNAGERGERRKERNNAFSLFCFFFFFFSSTAVDAVRVPSSILLGELGCQHDGLRFVRETPNRAGYLVPTHVVVKQHGIIHFALSRVRKLSHSRVIPLKKTGHNSGLEDVASHI